MYVCMYVCTWFSLNQKLMTQAYDTINIDIH